jgi:hypothetical protein
MEDEKMAATGTSLSESQRSSNLSDALDSAKGMASQVTDQVKEKTSQVVDQVKGQAASRADQQRQTVASGFQAVAQAFHGLGEDLENRDEGPVAEYAAQLGHSLAGQVERLAGYLQGRDVREIMDEAQVFARRSPALFLGGAFVLGLAASRFLKSSRPVPDINANMPDPSRALPAPDDGSPSGGQIWQRGTGAGGF